MLLQNLIEAKLLLVSNFLKGVFPFVIQFSHDMLHRFFLNVSLLGGEGQSALGSSLVL